MWRRGSGAGAIVALVVALATGVAPASGQDAGQLRVAHLSVGHGSATLYQGPCGAVGLVDASRGAADAILGQLDAWGDRSALRWVAVSNYRSGRLGDVVDVLTAEGVHVSAVHDRGGGRDERDSNTYREYHDHVTAAGIRQPVDVGDRFGLCGGNTVFQVVSAATDGSAAGQVPVADPADQGLCLTVRFDGFAGASCGDVNGVNSGTRTDVESVVGPTIGDVDWVVVNRNGAESASNVSYVSQLGAQAGVISAGENRAGNPSSMVLNRWRNAGTVLFQTADADGRPVHGDVLLSYWAGAATFEVRPEHGEPRTFPVDRPPPGGQTPPAEVRRLAGATRTATAVAISQATFLSADTAVLATSADFPDALSGSVLASSVAGPLLLTDPYEVPWAVLGELDRLGVSRVYVLGGTAAIDVAAVRQLRDRGMIVERIEGKNRFKTAARVAARIRDLGTVFLATGASSTDAGSVSAYAASQGWPILLVEHDRVNRAVLNVMERFNATRAIPVGGPDAIPDAVLDEVRARGVHVAPRIAGDSRWSTSYQVAHAHALHGRGRADAVWLASGSSFADALAAGAAAAASGGVLVLTPPDTMDVDGTDLDARGFVDRVRDCEHGGPVVDGTVVGGTGVVSSRVVEQLRAALDCAG